MNTILVFVACVCTTLSVRGRAIHSFAGPFLLNIVRVEDCPNLTAEQERHFYRLSHFNPRRPFDPQIISGNVTIPVTVDDTWWGSITFDTWSNNQWKSNFFVFNKTSGWCSMIRKNIPEYLKVVFQQDPKSRGFCQIPQGSYMVDHQPLRLTFPNVPVMPYGHYRANNLGGKGGRMLACYTVENFVIPRPT